MNKKNSLNRTATKLNNLPESLRVFAMSFVFGKVIKFAGTSKLRFEKLTENEAVISIKNRSRVQNHIGSVHAAAMGLLAETATGFVTGMSVPDNRLIVIKKMELSYKKLAKGDMKAVATLSDEQIAFIHDNEKGELSIPVVVTDENGIEPVECDMVWAWAPKRKK
jgi:acyl-coenzyme A thioesterase PaaI-like protein